MPLYEPYLPSRYVSPLLAILSRQDGRALERIHERAELPKSRRLSAGASITFKNFDRLLCATAAELQRSDLGFELGQMITMDDHDALSIALRQCRTADELLRMIARYRKMMTNAFFFIYERGSDFGELTFRPAAPLGKEALYAIEELFAVSFHTDWTALIAAEPGLEISLSMPRPRHVERYHRLCPTRFHFGANALPEVRCRIPVALLDKPLSQPALGGLPGTGDLAIDPHHSVRSREYSKWVSLILREAEGVQPRLADLAGMLSISSRTLNRYLIAEGTTLRGLNAAIRFERAKLLLLRSNEPIGQIAYRLGYSSPASFHSAFRKSAKLGPREFRALAR